jgi:hypothetical protein
VVRTLMQLAFALALIGTGWVAAKAQTQMSAPAFELQVEAPGGSTTIRCVRGCKLAWVQRGVNPNSAPQSSFEYDCTAGRCGSGLVGGWVVP